MQIVSAVMAIQNNSLISLGNGYDHDFGNLGGGPAFVETIFPFSTSKLHEASLTVDTAGACAK